MTKMTMSRCQAVYAAILVAGALWAQSAGTPGYDINYIGPRMADPILQHSKEMYVLYGCSYCHGLYLDSRGEATDLMHSRLVGRDENANLIGPLLRAGIPQTAKLSPMPQFSDLSDQQISAIATWIHYARQQGRYKELMEGKDLSSGNAGAGKAYFEEKCASRHLKPSDWTRDSRALRARILRPKFLDEPESWQIDRLRDARAAAARQRHLALLENYSAGDVASLVAYLSTK